MITYLKIKQILLKNSCIIKINYFFITLFTLLISLNANSFVPLFKAQNALNRYPEKLIIQIDSVTSEPLMIDSDTRFNHYKIRLFAQVKYVGASHSGINKGDIIAISYETSDYKQGVERNLCGYMPIIVPKEQDLCIIYLNGYDEHTFYTLEHYWDLQKITLKNIPYAVDNFTRNSLNATVGWINQGITELDLANYLRSIQGNN